MDDNKKYDEIGSNYRFFLGWRHASFAGILIVLYGTFSLSLLIYKEAAAFAWIVPLVASPIGILLWVIDVRTRDLYHAAIQAGKVLEGEKGGFYTILSDDVVLPAGLSPMKYLFQKKCNQSVALNVLFLGSSVVLFVYAILLFVKCP